MAMLNLWNDDPEEILLDLGFGCDEPDLSGRIPARFINHQSHARGINLQVFLEAQKNRLDLENPDVSSRFRQLEVLQQVTTAFTCLVGPLSSPLRSRPDLPPEAQERRRRMGMLFRRASKKSLRQMHNYKSQDLNTARLRDSKAPLKRDKSGSMEIPLTEEQEAESQPQLDSSKAQTGTLGSASMMDGAPPAHSSVPRRKTSPGQARDSFEMEEAS
ncbi:protein ITPRID1 [Mugil cephalus]|uniref:protein ITPRID1 n=1 Tax=Mugil cephalus TaxID=48193 RepID=UPI001FB6A7BB|nr:protein ITPRID1 [Mugil cephalus]